MATPPTLSSSGNSDWSTTTATKALSVTVSAGSQLVILAGTEDQSTTISTPTGGGLTYALQQSVVVAQYCTVYIWTATATSAQTFTLSVSSSNFGRWGFWYAVYSGSDGVGASSKTNVSGGAPSLSLTTLGDNSAILAITSDWNATDGTSRTWRTVNGITPTAGNGAELNYFRDASAYATYAARWNDAGPAGSKTVGLSAPTGQKYAIAAVEIKGVAGGGTPTAAEGGRGVVGLSATGKAVHVGKSSGVGVVGLTGRATARKVVAVGGSCSMGLAATGTARKTAPARGTATLGTAGTSVDRKVAAASGVAALPMVGTAVDRKVAVETGLATVGLAGTGTAAKKTTQAGLAALGLTGTRSGVAARQVAGTATLGLIGSGTARKVAVELGTVALGLAGTGAAAKRAVQAGLTPLGLTATRSGLVARQQSGTAAIGLAGYAANRKTVRQAGATAFGLAGASTQAKHATAAGTAALGLAAVATTGAAPIPARDTPTLTSATATVELVASSTARLVPRSEVTLR